MSRILRVGFIGLLLLILIKTLYHPRPQLLSDTPRLVVKTETVAHIPPHEHQHGDSLLLKSHHHHISSGIVRPTTNLLISRAEFVLHNADATTLHHAVLAHQEERFFNCPERPAPLFVIGEDQMHHPFLNLPPGYAQLIPAGSPLFLQTMVHNPLPPIGHGRDYYNVFAEIKLFSPPGERNNLRLVEMIQLDLNDDPCSDSFVVPGNTTSFTKGDPGAIELSPATHRFAESGKLIYLGGHIHGWEGGQNLAVYLNGELVKRFNTRKADDDPYRYDTPHGPVDIDVQAGDVLTITATYTNPTPTPVTGAMGILVAYFAPDN